MIGLHHPTLSCQMRRAYQLSSPYQRRRSEQSHHMTPLISDLFMFFLVFYVRLVNPIFCMCYKLGLEIVLEIIHCIFLFQVIYTYIYPFLLYSLFSLLFCLWNMWFKVFHTSYTLRLCITQEVPLPPFIFLIALETLRTMFSSVGGRVEEGSFVMHAKLFW